MWIYCVVAAAGRQQPRRARNCAHRKGIGCVVCTGRVLAVQRACARALASTHSVSSTLHAIGLVVQAQDRHSALPMAWSIFAVRVMSWPHSFDVHNNNNKKQEKHRSDDLKRFEQKTRGDDGGCGSRQQWKLHYHVAEDHRVLVLYVLKPFPNGSSSLYASAIICFDWNNNNIKKKNKKKPELLLCVSVCTQRTFVEKHTP